MMIDILSNFFSRWGLPEELGSDNGRLFVSKEFEEFMQKCGVLHSRTSL